MKQIEKDLLEILKIVEAKFENNLRLNRGGYLCHEVVFACEKYYDVEKQHLVTPKHTETRQILVWFKEKRKDAIEEFGARVWTPTWWDIDNIQVRIDFVRYLMIGLEK